MDDKMEGIEGDWGMRWSMLVADAWADEALRKKLIADPSSVFKDRGIKAPAGVTFKVIEDTPAVMHLVIPTKPAAAELSEEELTSVAGGRCGGCGCGHCRCGCGPCGGCGGCAPPCGPCGPCRCGGPCRCFG